MTMEFGSNGCDSPCTTCGEGSCQVCSDISGQVVMLFTLSDVVTNSTPAGSEGCEECEVMNVTHELDLMDSGTGISIANTADLFCGFPESVTLVGENFCVWSTGAICGNQIQYSFSYSLSVIVYRTDAGDLRCKVFVTWGDTPGGGGHYEDDFALATGATRFECLTMDRDSTLTSCSSSGTPRCSVPVDYNLQVSAA